MQRLHFTGFLFLLLTTSALAQIGGRYTYQFLNLSVSPRQAALGGRVLTTYDFDTSQALYNPATINPEMDKKLSMTYGNYLGDVNYGTASYAYLWDRRTQVIHGGATYINYGTFDGFDEQGNATSEFSASEVALQVGYAYQLGRSDFRLGGSLKFISSRLESYTSIGAAADVGLLYDNEYRNIRAALVVRNAGAQLTTYAGVREPLPLEVSLGFSQLVPNTPIRYHVTLVDLNYWNVAFPNTANSTTDLNGQVTQENRGGFLDEVLRHTILGLEFFPESAFQLRLGYNYRRGEELRVEGQRSFAGLTGGFSLKLNSWRLSYTHQRFNRASNTSLFGLSIDLL